MVILVPAQEDVSGSGREDDPALGARSSKAVDETTRTRYRWDTDQAIGLTPVLRG